MLEEIGTAKALERGNEMGLSQYESDLIVIFFFILILVDDRFIAVMERWFPLLHLVLHILI